MLNITKYYNPEKGLSVISNDGYQKYSEDIGYFSNVYSNIMVSSNSKSCIDSCWETGNIYYASNSDVKKIGFDGIEIASITLTNPSMVSVIQYSNVMSTVVSDPPQEDKGCWIADNVSGLITKTDNELNVICQTIGFNDSASILASVDGGCYVVSQTGVTGSLTKLSSNGVVQDSMDYSSFIPSISSFTDISEDSSGNLWVCANDRIYNMEFYNNAIVQNFVILPPIFYLDQKLGSIDVDRNSSPEYLYVAGGNQTTSFVLKYDGSDLEKSNTYQDIGFPYIIKVIQGKGSSMLYILEDSSRWT